MDQFFIEKAMSWSQDDIEHVRGQRRYWAIAEQNTTVKDTRKLCQKYVKATTMVLEHMTGCKGGKWEAECLTQSVVFPDELRPYVSAIFAFTSSYPRRVFSEIYGEL